MSSDDLTALVIAYNDVDTAGVDYTDLATARREGKVGKYHAAVIERPAARVREVAADHRPQQRRERRPGWIAARP